MYELNKNNKEINMRYLVFCLCLVGVSFAMSSRKPLQEKKVEAPISKPLEVDVDSGSKEDTAIETLEPDEKKAKKKTKKEKKLYLCESKK